MIFKKKEFFLIIFLILLQSCSGGSIGNFLESSFENLAYTKKSEESKNVLGNKKGLNLKNKDINKTNIEEIKKVESSKDVLEDKKGLNLKNKDINKTNIEEIKKVEPSKNVLKNKKYLKSEKKPEKTKKTEKFKNTIKKRKNGLQSYKIILILQNVDPKDPIEDLSTILNNSELNFEIESIERFLNSKNKIINKN